MPIRRILEPPPSFPFFRYCFIPVNTCESIAEPCHAKIRTAWLIVIIAAVACFFISTIRDGHNWGGDFAQYISHAKNIAMGRNYVDTGYVYNQLNPVIGPRAYPPGFPLSLSPVYYLFGLDLTAFKIQAVILYAASLWITALLFARGLSSGQLVAYLLVLGFCPIFWSQKDSIDSEHLFIPLWYLTILVADKHYRDGQDFHSEFVHALLLGALIFVAFATRTVGIVFLPCVVVCEFFQSGRRISKFGVAVIGSAVGLILLSKLVLPASGAGYLSQLERISLESIVANFRSDTVAFTTIWENGYSESARKLAGVLFTMIALLGFFRDNLPRPSFMGTAMVLYFGLVVVWPSASWVRMILPLLPGYLFYVLLGSAIPKFPPAVRRVLFACFCGIASLSYLAWYSRADFGAIDGVESDYAVELFQFVRENSDENDLCLFFKPRVLCLYTGRQATAFPDDGEGDAMSYASSCGVTLFIVRYSAPDSPKWDSLYESELKLSMQPQGLVEVWRNRHFRAYRRPGHVEERREVSMKRRTSTTTDLRLLSEADGMNVPGTISFAPYQQALVP